MKQLGLISAVIVLGAMAACGGGTTGKKGTPSVSNKKGLVSKPANATSMGKVTKATAPKAPAGAPSINTQQAGDDGDEAYAWQEDVDGDGTLDDVLLVVDDETGDLVLASTFESPCDDGTSLEAAFYVLVHTDGSGEYGFAASDVCGEGAAIYGCNFDASGNDTGCGSCVIPADGTDFTCESTDPSS